MSQAAASAQGPPRKVKPQVPQKTVDDFWDVFTTKYPGKVLTILPQSPYAKSKNDRAPKGTAYGEAALTSYDEAKVRCVDAVKTIAKECRRVNMRYRDPHFDIEFDLKWHKDDCLEGLVQTNQAPFNPNSVKRVPDIFDEPQFYIEDATPSDIRQGYDGDCWFLSALSALGNKKGLIEKVCVARDEAVGVYGFVFHRDGEWIFTIIDDKLYLNSADYDESREEKSTWDQVNRIDSEEEYRKAYQTGSRALYFAQCSHENETWLPLMEKAYAKAHGDYRAIYGGFTGEAIEDLTGGVTTELFTTDILDKEKFWTDEIMKVNHEFLFGCVTGIFDDWKGNGWLTDRKGVVSMHAYSILEAREVNGQRLLKIRNPWGKTEWQGAWSDGSEQWTPEWMTVLKHKFGNDGIFWISYKDLLRKYQSFDRTRLFGPEWTITQKWVSLDVPWSADYHDTKFTVKLTKSTPVVIVLSQLDDRYWRGLQGQYIFSLHFRLDKDGDDQYIARSHGNYLMNRSVSLDLPELEPGLYNVLMKITASRYDQFKNPDEVLRDNCKVRQEKVLQIGLAYDLAHVKGIAKESEEEEKVRLDKEAKAKIVQLEQDREDFRKAKRKIWETETRTKERKIRHKQRLEEHKRKKAEAKKAADALNAGEAEKAAEIPNGVTTNGIAEVKTDKEEIIKEETTKNGTADEKAEVKAEGTSAQNETANGDNVKNLSGGDIAESTVLLSTQGAKIDTQDAKNDTEAKLSDAQDVKDPKASVAPLPESKDEANGNQTEPDLKAAKLVEGKDATTQDNIDAYNKALESIKAKDESAVKGEPTVKDEPDVKDEACPPDAPAAPQAPAADGDGGSDVSSILSFDPSVDDFLDLGVDPAAVDEGTQTAEEEGTETAVAAADDEDNAEFANDPWNAVCVVGLRVFSKEGEVSVNVVKPKNDDDEEDTPLDLDDPSKGISADGPLKPEDSKAETEPKEDDKEVEKEAEVAT